mmetsp:Transcript_60404/g.142917  ORF Transcript_60404/g.142917 Transcript_60404/m.142917 type:complete len:203 (+) Transcript_60404:182-790(+)
MTVVAVLCLVDVPSLVHLGEQAASANAEDLCFEVDLVSEPMEVIEKKTAHTRRVALTKILESFLCKPAVVTHDVLHWDLTGSASGSLQAGQHRGCPRLEKMDDGEDVGIRRDVSAVRIANLPSLRPQLNDVAEGTKTFVGEGVLFEEGGVAEGDDIVDADVAVELPLWFHKLDDGNTSTRNAVDLDQTVLSQNVGESHDDAS